MPTNLPVPSKGALRALRNLALGTSCTVAVGAGLLTEDRRRRIHTARQVYDNAQTLKSLKSSRHYHTAEVLDDNALRQSEDAFWLPSNVAKSKSFAASQSPAKQESPRARVKPIQKPVKRPSIPVSPATLNVPTSFRSKLGSYAPPKTSLGSTESINPGGSRDISIPNHIPGQDTLRGIFAMQQRLASTIEGLLDSDSPSDIELATSKFLSLFRDGMKVTKNGMYPGLVDAAIRLHHLAATGSQIQEQILLVVARNGPIQEAQFQQFSPTHIMTRMLNRARGPLQEIDKDLLEAVASIYLTPFVVRNPIVTDLMQQLGEKLCATACEAGLYDLTEKLFARIQFSRGERPVRCVEHLIEAVHALHPKKNFRYFKLLYTQTSPDQVQFFKIGTLVLDSLSKKDPSKMEEFLDLATIMAQSNQLQMSSTWLLRVLGQSWRTNRDITSTRALFERMIPKIFHIEHPQAVFAAIIQFCVEARLETEAVEYYARLCEVYPESAKDVRVLGHLAYAKALRSDWSGVADDLQMIHEFNPTRSLLEESHFSAIVTPIFKTYAQSHNVTETEDFIRVAVDEWQLKITSNISNIMIGVYIESKEIDSMLRWMELTASVGCPTDAATVNVLFKALAKHCNFAFLEIYRLYQRICTLDAELGTKSTDADSLLLLQNIAISKSRNDHEARTNLSHLPVPSDEAYGSTFEFGEGSVYWEMIRAYLAEKLETVIQLFNDAQLGPVKLGPKPLLLAVKATLKLNGDSLNEAAGLIKSAQDGGENVAGSISKLMVYRIEKLDGELADTQDIATMVQNDIKALKLRGIDIPDTILTHAMSVLVRRGKYRRAIDLWQATSHLSRKPGVPDLVTLNVLLEAYIGIQFNAGIRWVMQSLADNRILPDRRFQSVLNNERRRVQRQMQREVNHQIKNYMKCIEGACTQVQTIRLGVQEEKTVVKCKIMKIMEKATLMASLSRTPVSLSGTPVKEVRRVGIQMERVDARGFSVAQNYSEENGHEEIGSENLDLGVKWTPLGLAVAAGSG